MALRGAAVSRDKWHQCIPNVFGALATLTPPPVGAAAGIGPGPGNLTPPLRLGAARRRRRGAEGTSGKCRVVSRCGGINPTVAF